MKQKIIILILVFTLSLAGIVFWQEYSFRKNIELKSFDVCMKTIPSDILQDYRVLKDNIQLCKDLSKVEKISE
jgi:hypothetical protein